MKKKDYKNFEEKLKGVYLLRNKLKYLQINKKEEAIKKLEKELMCYQMALSCLDDLEKEIIKGVYFNHRSLMDISFEVGYSYYYCSKKRVKAVKKMMFIMDEN